MLPECFLRLFACLYLLRCAPQQWSSNRTAFIIFWREHTLTLLASHLQSCSCQFKSTHQRHFVPWACSRLCTGHMHNTWALCQTFVCVARVRCSQTVGIRGKVGQKGGIPINPSIGVLAANFEATPFTRFSPKDYCRDCAGTDIFIAETFSRFSSSLSRL